jgi:hypothetical protein
VNSIDNQRVTSKNTKITGNKPAKPISSHSYLATAKEINNKLNMRRKPQNAHMFCESVGGLPIKIVNLLQDDATS